jgi:hypothetical protein
MSKENLEEAKRLFRIGEPWTKEKRQEIKESMIVAIKFAPEPPVLALLVLEALDEIECLRKELDARIYHKLPPPKPL